MLNISYILLSVFLELEGGFRVVLLQLGGDNLEEGVAGLLGQLEAALTLLPQTVVDDNLDRYIDNR